MSSKWGDRDEVRERAADRRRFRLTAPQPIKLKKRDARPAEETPARKQRAPRQTPRAPKAKHAKFEPIVELLEQHEELQRLSQSELWLELRPMPDPTTTRCEGSGRPARVVGHLLVCVTCGLKCGVVNPTETSPEHERPKEQP